VSTLFLRGPSVRRNEEILSDKEIGEAYGWIEHSLPVNVTCSCNHKNAGDFVASEGLLQLGKILVQINI
jgi:hypothetical protein